eukprot:5283939-Prymnesium_polylepis.1
MGGVRGGHPKGASACATSRDATGSRRQHCRHLWPRAPQAALACARARARERETHTHTHTQSDRDIDRESVRHLVRCGAESWADDAVAEADGEHEQPRDRLAHR